MSNSQLEYLVGSTWTVEDNLIKFSLVDSLHFPLSLEAVVSNPINVREVVYERYQAVRLIDLNSNRVLFYGKLEAVIPSYTGYYGDSVKLIARDNLQELLKVSVNEDVTYGAINRSAVIEDIINGGTGTEFSRHAWPGNILTSDTAKFKPSGTQAGSGDCNRNLANSSRNALGLIENFSKIDLQDSPNHKLGGRDFFLDTNFNKVASDTSGVATPYFHYFSRGTVPTTPQTNGLTLEFKGIEAAQVNSVLPNFTFPRNSSEIVTKVRIEWVDEERIHQELELILIHHDAPASGAFVAGTNITWGSGKSAKIEAVISDNRALLISSANSNDTWLDTISGQTISDGTRTAAVNATDATIAGSIRETIGQDIELVMKSLELEKLDETKNVALQTLQQSDDEIVRGNLTCVKWPTHKITDAHTGGAHSTILTDSGASFLNNGIRVGDEVVNVTDSVTGLITALNATTITTSGTPDMSWENGNTYEIYVPNRAGYVVYTKGFEISDIGDQNALITRIAFEEGPGIQTSTIDIVLHVTGHAGEGLPKRNQTRNNNSTEDANFASPGQIGARNISTLTWSYSGALTTPTSHQVDWSAGTLILSDGREFTIAGGNTGAIAASPGAEFIYFDIDTPTVFISTPTVANAKGLDKIFIAKCTRATSPGTVPNFIAYGMIAGNSISTNYNDLFNVSIDASQFANESVTNAILRKGAQPFITNLSIRGTAYNAVIWDNGTGSTNATIKYGAGTTSGIAHGTSTGLSDNTTYYAYINSSASDPQTLTLSTTYTDALSDANVFLALIVVGVTADGGAPTILPFNSKVPTISAQAIAANAITADHIAAGSINFDRLIQNEIDISSAMLADGSVVTAKIGALQVTSALVADGAISTEGKLSPGVITETKLGGLSVTETKIGNNAVIDTKLEANLVLSTNIIAGNASPGARWVLNSAGITGYNSSNVEQVKLRTDADAIGGSIYVGGTTTKAILDRTGITVVGAPSPFEPYFMLKTTTGASNSAYIGLSTTEMITAGIDKGLKLMTVNSSLDITLDATGDVIVDNDILPNTTNTYDLGNVSKVWENVYVNNLRAVDAIHPTSSIMSIGGDVNPTIDSAYDLGTQTSKQWANVWSDLINGADIMIANKWRMLESELYEGYPEGWAVGHSEEWLDGKSLWKERDMIGKAKPTFVVTDDFIEFRGRKITVEKLDKLLSLVD